MPICRTIRSFASLAEDAFDALIELVFAGTKRTANDIRERAKAEAAERGRAAVAERRAERLAETEAEEEVWEPRATVVTRGGVDGATTLWEFVQGKPIYFPQSSPVVQPAQAATGERPPPPSAPPSPADFPADVVGDGQPKLTPEELDAAALVVRRHARKSIFDDDPENRQWFADIAEKFRFLAGIAGAGHPSEKLLAAAAYGLREYADSHHCGAPTYWRSIAGQLDTK